MGGGMVNAHPAPWIHHLVRITYKGPSKTVRHPLVTGDIPRAIDLCAYLCPAQPRGQQGQRLKVGLQPHFRKLLTDVVQARYASMPAFDPKMWKTAMTAN